MSGKELTVNVAIVGVELKLLRPLVGVCSIGDNTRLIAIPKNSIIKFAVAESSSNIIDKKEVKNLMSEVVKELGDDYINV